MLGSATFAHARFSGDGVFADVQFCGRVNFTDARFAGVAVFDGAQFGGDALFSNVRVSKSGNVSFKTRWIPMTAPGSMRIGCGSEVSFYCSLLRDGR